jgi:hypothetical protein
MHLSEHDPTLETARVEAASQPVSLSSRSSPAVHGGDAGTKVSLPAVEPRIEQCLEVGITFAELRAQVSMGKSPRRSRSSWSSTERADRPSPWHVHRRYRHARPGARTASGRVAWASRRPGPPPGALLGADGRLR